MSEHNITRFYGHDHDELDQHFQTFRDLKRTDYPGAKVHFRQFKFGLQRHIIWEEEVLFPVFEEKTGLTDSGPTAVMRREHLVIKERLEAVHRFVQKQDPESDAQEAALLEVLAEHNKKEEQILYPAIDKLTTDDERRAMYAKMDAVPVERYQTCGCRH